MKKQSAIKCFLIAFAIFFAGCSSDDNELENNPQQILLKKITETVYFSGESETKTVGFDYENGILVSSSTTSSTYPDVNRTDFTYNGAKVFQSINFTNNVERSRNTYVYEGDLLAEITSSSQSKTVFTHINGIPFTAQAGYMSNNSYVISETRNYTFFNGNLLEEQVTSSNFGSSGTSKKVFTFDAKNNPAKFMNKYLRYVFSCEGFRAINENNQISRSYYSTLTSTTPQTSNYQITYDSNNFPTEIKQISQDGSIISLTTIEYQ